MTHSDNLLTPEEIKEIEKTAANNPILRHEHVVNLFGQGHTSIYKMSPRHGLIFIKGNEATGFNHIHARHDFWSTITFWKATDDKNAILDNPSKFNKSYVPIRDYILIADGVYGPQNINTDKNNDPSRFDMFTAEFTDSYGLTAIYHLLTYKDTKIVHTLFPQTKKNNLKRHGKLHFGRGDVIFEQSPDGTLIEITIPYLDATGKPVYSIFLRKHSELKLEKAFIFVHDSNGKSEGFIYLGERTGSILPSRAHYVVTYQHADLRGFERIILDIHNNR
jgi:hypothetical protein